MKKISICLLILAFSINIIAQDFLMDNTSVTTCAGSFYDSGGSSSNIGSSGVCFLQGSYRNNEDYTKTFCSGLGQNLLFTFDVLEIVGNDWLKVYDGNNTAAPLLMTLTSVSASPSIVSSGTCLTFQFHSGDNGTTGFLSGNCDNGGNWTASIQCVTIYPINISGITNTCSGIFTDDGGISGNYSDNVIYTKTFCPDAGSCVKINFSSLQLGSGDELKFFDGTSAVGSPILTLTQSSPIPPFGVSSNSGNCLTAQFTSDGSGNAPGWIATTFCPPSCGTPPNCASNPPADNQCISATPICNLNGFCGNTSSSYNSLDHNGVDWDNLSGLNFCGSIENNSWLSFIANSPTAVFNVWTMNCANSDGIQMEVYETTDCQTFTSHSNCVSVGTPTDFTIQAYNLMPGNSYYLMIDGFAGDNCDYIISAVSGINYGPQITPEQTICSGYSATITVTGLEPGASYTWSSVPNDTSMVINGNSVNVSPLQNTNYYVSVSGSSINTNCSPVNQTLQTTVVVLPESSPMCMPQYDCDISITSDNINVCSGIGVNLQAEGNINFVLLSNDFNDGTIGLGWTATTAATFTNPCGSSPPGGGTYLWMGNASPAPRRIESLGFNVSGGGIIKFYLRYAVQGDSSPCEGPDEIDEGVTLQYSNDQGTTWQAIAYFNPSGIVESNGNLYLGQSTSVANGATNFTTWAQYTFPIPAEAQTTSTRFRWIQEISTDNVYDHWGLDSIYISGATLASQVQWTSNPPGLNFTGNMLPTQYPEVSTTYYAQIVEGYSQCTDSICINVLNCPNLITGTIFLDDNQNGVLDTGEAPFSGAIVKISPTNLYYSSDSNGIYNAYVDTGLFTVNIPNPQAPYSVTSPEQTASFSGSNQIDYNNNFGLYGDSLQDVSIYVTCNGANPFTGAVYHLFYRNNGNFAMNGDIKFIFCPLLGFQYSFPAPVYTSADTISWNYYNLLPGETREIIIHCNVAQVIFGTQLITWGIIEPLSGDDVSYNNVFKHVETVTASYDPNDKKVNPDILTYDYISEMKRLVYTINFQNTGTDVAHNVIIRDTLCENVNPASFLMISTSHPCVWNMQGNGVLEFVFNNILLPDSNSNELESHGYILYSILPADSLNIGDTISNFADIYFDFNSPVRTNTAISTVVDSALYQTKTVVSKNILKVIPNPFKNQAELIYTLEENANVAIEIFNITGSRLFNKVYGFQKTGMHKIVLDAAALGNKKGLYLIKLNVDKNTICTKIVIE